MGARLVSTDKHLPATWEGRKKVVQRLSAQLDRIQDYLEAGQTLEEKLAESRLKDITIAQGVLVDKLLLLQGEPTTIISNADRQRLDELAPALLAEIKRRGLTAQLTERTAALTVPPSGALADEVPEYCPNDTPRHDHA